MDFRSFQTNSQTELVANIEKPESWFFLALISTIIWSIGMLVTVRHIPNITTILFNGTQPEQLWVIGFLMHLFLFPIPLSFWYRTFDRKIKLLINKKGIGYSTHLLAECKYNPYTWVFNMPKSTFTSDSIGYKQEFHRWNSISAYQFIVRQKRPGLLVYDLQIKPTLENDNLKIEISKLNEPFSKIQNLVVFLASKEGVKDLGITQKSEFVNQDSKKEVIGLATDDSDLLIRKRKPHGFIRFLIYFWSFNLGTPIVYNVFSNNYSDQLDWVALSITLVFYGIFVYLFRRKYKLVRITIGKQGISDEKKMYYWKDVSSYQFTVAIKTVTSINKGRTSNVEVVVDTLTLWDKQGEQHNIDVTDSTLNKTIEEIQAKVKAVAKSLNIEDLGFVKE